MPLCVLALAALTYGAYGFGGPLYRDYGIYLYGAQMVAEGVPPYAGIFDHKGPLPQMLGGLGILLFGWMGPDDVHAVRLAFFAAGCLSAVAVYLLGEGVFRSRLAGLLAALTFLGFYAYARPVASGPEPKTPMVLFEALSLLLISRRRWFWAGLCGSLAFLVWQPMGVLPLVAFALAVAGSREERAAAALRVVAGTAAPLALVAGYSWYKGGLQELLDGLVLFNLLHVSRGGLPPVFHPLRVLREILAGYGVMILPILIGLAAILRLYFVRPLEYRHAPLLLSLPVFVAWSALDFQVREDLYTFLPYAAAGFGAVLAGALRRLEGGWLAAALCAGSLLAAALSSTPLITERGSPGPPLSEQRESVERITERLGEDARIVSINAPQVLVLLDRQNPNPYLFTTDGVDRQIEAKFPGGFDGWIRSIDRYDPDAISFFADAQRQLPVSGMSEEHREALTSWLEANYRAEKIGNFWLYVKKDPGGS